MLNQFYNYLSEKLVSYFENTKIQAGDKVYLQFDEEKQVEVFNQVLANTTQITPFIYQHARGSEYKTYALVINDIQVVVATSLGVTADYLVTLRNQVTEQHGIWKDTALLIVCHSAVDSIYSGMRDLQREGMPLNVKTISRNLMNEIENSELSKMDKEVTKFYLKKKEEDLFQTTLWDYEEILAILNKAEITKEDYHTLGLFYDKSLEQYSAPQMKNRLQENFELHEKVDRLAQYEDRKAQLEKLFDEKGVKLLSQEDWYERDFAEIKNARENITKGSKSLNYIENDKKLTLEGLNYWEKPKAHTKTGERKRHIIIFNPNKIEKVSISFKFDESLRKEFIDSKCVDIATNSGQTLKVSFEVNPDETTFKKIIYKHNKESKSTYEFNIVVINGPESILQAIKPLYEIDNKQQRIVVTIEDEVEKLVFGDGSSIVEESIDVNGQILNLKADTTLKISENSQGWEEASLKFDLNYEGVLIPLEIKEESARAYPVKSLLLWKYKRENKQDIIFNEVKAIQGVNSFYLDEKFKWYLQLEQEMIDKKVRYGVIQLDGIEKQDLPLSSELAAVYEELLAYYKAKHNVPSLVYMDDTLKALCQKYIRVFNQEVAAIKENSIFSEDPTKVSLLKLGMLKDGNQILYSSLSPINIAYQLEILEQCGTEKIETHILERLKPNNLLPYIYPKLQ